MKNPKNLKKLFALLVTGAMLFAFAAPCFAAPASTVTYTEDLGNGIRVVTTIVTDQTLTRSYTKTGSVTKDYTYNNASIGSVVLNGAFVYDGSTASATNASESHWVASGWSFNDRSVWYGGNAVYLTATIYKFGTPVPVSMSLSCSPSGTLSGS